MFGAVALLCILCSVEDLHSEDQKKKLLIKSRRNIYHIIVKHIPLNLGNIWSSVSEDAKSLLKRLLDPNPVKRISAREALEHNWIQKKNNNTFSKEISAQVLGNLNTFHVSTLNRLIERNETPEGHLNVHGDSNTI